MRDPTRLRAFQLADELTLEIYRATHSFPSEERYGMTNQIRRAAVSIGSNIVLLASRNAHNERSARS